MKCLNCGEEDCICISEVKIQMVSEAVITISGEDGKILEIMHDGEVITHKKGSESEAAEIFYNCLEFEGKTLHRTIQELKEENKNLKEEIRVIREE